MFFARLSLKKLGLAYFEKGKTVTISYFCKSANSTTKSSFRLIGIGKF